MAAICPFKSTDVTIRLISKKSCYHVEGVCKAFCWTGSGGWWSSLLSELVVLVMVGGCVEGGTCISTSADTLAMAMPKEVGRKVGHRGPHAARVYRLGSSGQTGDGGRQGLHLPCSSTWASKFHPHFCSEQKPGTTQNSSHSLTTSY